VNLSPITKACLPSSPLSVFRFGLLTTPYPVGIGGRFSLSLSHIHSSILLGQRPRRSARQYPYAKPGFLPDRCARSLLARAGWVRAGSRPAGCQVRSGGSSRAC